MYKTIKKREGQVALLVLLVSAVVMTIGLGVSRKTVVTTTVEKNEEQLKQAFNTAESGIEYFLGTGKTQFTAVDNLSQAIISTKNIGEGSTVNFDQFTLPNNNLVFWLVGHNADGSIDYSTFYRGNSLSLCVESGFNRAIKVDFFYRDVLSSAYKVKRGGYNLMADYVSGFTNISPGQGTCAGGYKQVDLAAVVSLGSGTPLLLGVKPIGNGARFYLLGSGPIFPIQGIKISSTGAVGDINTGVKRKINVQETFQMPSFMLEAVTAYGSVLSN